MNDRPIDLAENRAARLLGDADGALEAGTIDEAEWHRRIAAVITPAYLAPTTPWGQSGKSGDAASWERARGLLGDAARTGTFLDVGCASGYLMSAWRAGAPPGTSRASRRASTSPRSSEEIEPAWRHPVDRVADEDPLAPLR